jgi:hypothetical protein
MKTYIKNDGTIHEVARTEEGNPQVYGMVVPDYDNRETINRLPTQTSTWTVDRNGFINAEIYADTPVDMALNINGKVVMRSPIVQNPRVAGTYQVKKGDVISTTIYSGTVSIYCYFVPPVFAKEITPNIAENFNNYMCVPDYVNQEPANLISVSGNTWTADRTGYVTCTASGSGVSQGFRVMVMIDNIMAYQVGKPTVDTPGAYSVLLPISKGQVLKVSYDNPVGTVTLTCRFIPPKFIQKQAPVIVEAVTDTRQGYITVNDDHTLRLNKPVNITTQFRDAVVLGSFTNKMGFASAARYGNLVLVTMAGSNTQANPVPSSSVVFTINQSSPLCPAMQGMALIIPNGSGGNCFTWQPDGTFQFWGDNMPAGTAIGCQIVYFCKGE